jgi:hypothetical protein
MSLLADALLGARRDHLRPSDGTIVEALEPRFRVAGFDRRFAERL